jgi:D-alanine-D-alanine ligase-like ATP-grasp enzyme
LIELFDEGLLTNVESIEVEPKYGYATRIRYRNGSIRMTRGNDVGLNPSGACDIAKDKGHTKFFLTSSGINCPAGEEFILPSWAARLEPKMNAAGIAMRMAASAPEYISKNLAYPVFVKSVDGSQGFGVFRCERAAEVQSAMEHYERERIKVAIVEESVNLPDFRLVVLDGKVISAYGRQPLSVIGDGRSTIEELLESTVAKFRADGRIIDVSITDPRIRHCLDARGERSSTVPPLGVSVPLLHLSNLSLGGSAEDLTDVVDPRWKAMASRITGNLGMRYCGVDLACADIRSADSAYSVLEVNAAPGLDHYAEVGEAQRARVRKLYTQVLDAVPHAE